MDVNIVNHGYCDVNETANGGFNIKVGNEILFFPFFGTRTLIRYSYKGLRLWSSGHNHFCKCLSENHSCNNYYNHNLVKLFKNLSVFILVCCTKISSCCSQAKLKMIIL